MLLSEIISYVADRTGENDRSTLVREINNELRRIWYTSDVEGSLFEFDVIPDQQRIVTLPWYVFQVKGVKRTVGAALTLLTPRPAYLDFSFAQSPHDIRILSRTPLFQSFANAGPLTLKLRKAAGESFIVNVRGADHYGVDVAEEVAFSAGDLSKTTDNSYVTIHALSKSAYTSVDVEVRDITNEIVSIIPSNLTEVWCCVCQIFDRNTVAQTYPLNGYTVLFKKQPMLLWNENDTVPDPLGVVLQRAVTSARLGMDNNPDVQKKAGAFGALAEAALGRTQIQENEGKMIPIGFTADPFTTVYPGNI